MTTPDTPAPRHAVGAPVTYTGSLTEHHGAAYVIDYSPWDGSPIETYDVVVVQDGQDAVLRDVAPNHLAPRPGPRQWFVPC